MADSFTFPWAREFDADQLAEFIESLWGAASGENGLPTLDAIEKVIANHRPPTAGESLLDESLIETIAQKVTTEVFLAAAGRTAAPCPLSKRELECLIELARGAPHEGVGHALGLSVQTVKTHLRNAYQTLRAGNAARAVAIAVHHGWISAPDLRLHAPPAPAEHRAPRDWAIIYRERVAALRDNPGTWHRISLYSSPSNARRPARSMCEGTYVQFRPPGTFDAEVCDSEQGQWPVRARYTGARVAISTPHPGGEA
ncbi:helix-turn-helix transcriptional regulator [Streptomyces sp. STR69]|uniref:helix-turn-helix transcriptional regulator n=1 Tax=Streptomyces sp. STR69 TaxID=1796942 RepID=UPI0021C7E903|nr:LuxR C-terminal-related transcriptional regulator [Streptomyces sp. STR69]